MCANGSTQEKRNYPEELAVHTHETIISPMSFMESYKHASKLHSDRLEYCFRIMFLV
jgi:hypothetical protein